MRVISRRTGCLEITPDFLDAVLTRLKALGFAIVDLDRALTMIANRAEQPFAVLTFDDGYKDTRDFALPILEKHAAPFTMYVTTGFAERTARLWWVELEEAIARLPRVKVSIAAARSRSAGLKRGGEERRFRDPLSNSECRFGSRICSPSSRGLAREAGVDPQSIPRELCLDWAGIEAMARNPLCTIGVHTLTHPRLGKLDERAMREELAASRAIIEAHIGKPALHLAYPVGNSVAAGEREFQAARELGFKSAVTTRPGMIFPAHDTRRTALPRALDQRQLAIARLCRNPSLRRAVRVVEQGKACRLIVLHPFDERHQRQHPGEAEHGIGNELREARRVLDRRCLRDDHGN